FEDFANRSALDASFPFGSYTINIATAGNPSSTLDMSANAYPPVPHFANYDAVKTYTTAGAHLIQWDKLPGPTENDFIQLEVAELLADGTQGRVVFPAPDPCAPIELPNTSDSIAVPDGKMQPGQPYVVTLSFFHSGPFAGPPSDPLVLPAAASHG